MIGQDQYGELFVVFFFVVVCWWQFMIFVLLVGIFLFDEGGEGFVEGGVVVQVEFLVCQFVED